MMWLWTLFEIGINMFQAYLILIFVKINQISLISILLQIYSVLFLVPCSFHCSYFLTCRL